MLETEKETDKQEKLHTLINAVCDNFTQLYNTYTYKLSSDATVKIVKDTTTDACVAAVDLACPRLVDANISNSSQRTSYASVARNNS